MSKMAIEFGDQVWRNEAGQYHRVDGPAVITSHGSQIWFVNGLCHRLDGPAYISADGAQAWWINRNSITDHAITWIKENNFPDYTKWTDTHKIMFRLAFVGL